MIMLVYCCKIPGNRRLQVGPGATIEVVLPDITITTVHDHLTGTKYLIYIVKRFY